MRVVFRADANKNVGMGHIMRCLSIADAFSDAGCQIEFLIADDGISKIIQNRGYKVRALYTNYQKMLEELDYWPYDIKFDFVVVDSYYASLTYLSSLHEKVRSAGGKLVYIDDVYTQPYPVDILLNYNAYATKDIYDELYINSSVEKPRLFLGTTYAPLRSMFRKVDKKIQSEKVKSILISTGGADELHLALAIIRSLVSFRDGTDRVYHILLGAMNADRLEIERAVLGNNSIVLHENVSDMKSLICSCDLAISAAGSTLYEISACGVPLITYSLADNQMPGATAFERLGLAVNIGDIRDPKSINSSNIISGDLDNGAVEKILLAAEDLSNNYQRRVMMGKQMQKLVDGFGANRMVQDLLG